MQLATEAMLVEAGHFMFVFTWSSSADCLLSFRRLAAAPVMVAHTMLQTARVRCKQQPAPAELTQLSL